MSCRDWLASCECSSKEKSKQLLLLVIFLNFFLNNLLTSAVVPIVTGFPLMIANHRGSDNWNPLESCILKNGTQTSVSCVSDHLLNAGVILLASSKAICQVVFSPLAGLLIARIGCGIPLFAGWFIMFGSTLIFIFAPGLPLLLISRCLQGLACALFDIAGISLIAATYEQSKHRDVALTHALIGHALGVWIGPAYGGFLSEEAGKETPFFIMMIPLVFVGIMLPACVPVRLSSENRGIECSEWKKLLLDAHIMIPMGSLLMANLTVVILGAGLPTALIMSSTSWHILFITASFANIIAIALFGQLGQKLHSYWSLSFALIALAFMLIITPFGQKLWNLSFVLFISGFAVGVTLATVIVFLMNLVTLRHHATYVHLFTIMEMVIALPFAFGPGITLLLIQGIGFRWTMHGSSLGLLVLGIFLIIWAHLTSNAAEESRQGLLEESQQPKTKYDGSASLTQGEKPIAMESLKANKEENEKCEEEDKEEEKEEQEEIFRAKLVILERP